MPHLHAVVLAGGRARRLGGVDKVMTRIAGRTLLTRVVEAVAAADRVAVAGPTRAVDLPREVIWAREEPHFGGPAAGVAAAVRLLAPARDDEILVLPADLVRPDAMVAALSRVGTIAVDPDGRRQWACVRIRAGDLIDELTAADDVGGLPLRALLGALDLQEVALSQEDCADLDTPDDVKEYADDQQR